MTTTITLDAGTALYLDMDFLDASGNPAIPASIEYRIDSGTGTSVRAATSVTPAAHIEITITSSDNTLLSNTHSQEDRIVTVKASYGAGDALVSHYTYRIRRTAYS